MSTSRTLALGAALLVLPAALAAQERTLPGIPDSVKLVIQVEAVKQ